MVFKKSIFYLVVLVASSNQLFASEKGKGLITAHANIAITDAATDKFLKEFPKKMGEAVGEGIDAGLKRQPQIEAFVDRFVDRIVDKYGNKEIKLVQDFKDIINKVHSITISPIKMLPIAGGGFLGIGTALWLFKNGIDLYLDKNNDHETKSRGVKYMLISLAVLGVSFGIIIKSDDIVRLFY